MKYLLAILAVLCLCGSAEAIGRRQVVVQKQVIVQQRVQRVRVQRVVAHPVYAAPVFAPVYSQQLNGDCHSGSLQLNGGGCSQFFRSY